MDIFQIFTYVISVIMLKQLFTSGSLNKNLDVVSVFIFRYSPRLRRVIVKCDIAKRRFNLRIDGKGVRSVTKTNSFTKKVKGKSCKEKKSGNKNFGFAKNRNPVVV